MIDFQNTLFSMPLLVGSIFMVMGFIMYKFPPKDINALYGYRTSSSMKNKARWDFAQIYSSKLMIYCGVALLLFSMVGLFFKPSEDIGVLIATIAIITSLVLLIYKTEIAIKKQFKGE